LYSVLVKIAEHVQINRNTRVHIIIVGGNACRYVIDDLPHPIESAAEREEIVVVIDSEIRVTVLAS